MQVPDANRLEFARHPNDNSLQAGLRPFGNAFGKTCTSSDTTEIRSIIPCRLN
jgi:hypothetical protein